MKVQTLIKIAAITLMAAGAGTAAHAATAALSGQINLRPITPQDIKDYGLTNGVQGSAGLPTVGLGQPAYLEALVGSATNVWPFITNVTWTLASQPVGSQAALQDSPLGSNVPTFRPRERTDLQVVSRKLLRPDLAGQYVVAIQLDSAVKLTFNGTTNTTFIMTTNITAGTYLGIKTCMLCHSGGSGGGENIYATFTNTAHATFFTRAISGTESDHYGKNCISCHTVGYDVNTNAVNGGFDDVAKQLGWVFPNNITNLAAAATNWASMPAKLQNLANIQCENCHGPGSEHAAALGDTTASNWPRLAVSYGAGTCSQCHDSKPNHIRSAEWNLSGHANAPRTPSGAGRGACVRCHTASGFKEFASNGTLISTNLTYEALTCQACHDPHDASNPAQLRVGNTFVANTGLVVTNAGLGTICINCHQSRNGEVTQNITNFIAGRSTWVGGSSFGPHDSTAGEMLLGINGYTYGLDIPSGSHFNTVSNTCVGCHMQTVDSKDPGFTKVGDHTFSMAYSMVTTNGITNVVDQVKVCVQCHGPIEDFNLVRKDYDGDGTIDGIQDEVQHLLDKLSTMLPNGTYRADGKYVADGLVKPIDGRNTVKTNWPAKFLQAAWNHMFVTVEGSHGIHNAPYAIGLLKASIADLSGDYNNDGLPDAWQIANFGSLTNKNSAPNATPAGDGIPNWLKYQLGLNPTVAGLTVPDGVVWVGANGTSLVNPPGTNTVLKVYTAAEVAFDTVQGTKYQIQGISAIGGTWQNIGTPITGTGAPISYVTPLRKGVQQFFRVVVNP
jgi:hypothetical protein